MRRNARIGKNSSIIVIAEGVGKTTSLVEAIEKNIGIEVRVSVLGYTQRGETLMHVVDILYPYSLPKQ